MTTIYDSGTQAISDPSGYELAVVTGPAAFSALLDCQHHNGLDVRLSWYVNDGGELATAWVDRVTIDTTTPEGPLAILTPPVPVGTTATLWFEHVAGTPGLPANVRWVVYQL